MRSHRRPCGSIHARAELPQLGETLRGHRLRRGLGVADAAGELGIPSKSLRAVEWDRFDLLDSPDEADRILSDYAALLGLDLGLPQSDGTVEAEAEAEAEAPSSPRRPRRALGALLVAGLAVLLVVGFLYFRGDETTSPDDRESVPQLSPQPQLSSTVSVPAASIPPPVEPATPVVPQPPAKAPVRLVLTAALGESWVEAHAGSPTGPVLYRGTLPSGRTLRLSGERFWLRLGAASNIAFALNGRRVATALQGTVDVLVTPRGIRRAPA